MQLSESWLRELANPPVDTPVLVEQLTMAGLEVASVAPAAAGFTNVIVAQVLSTIQHPNADKLKVCQVNIGQPQPIQIVCGAANVREGMKVPAALVGAVLPGDFKINQSKLRGEVSLGMLCSEKELGLADQASGIMELSDSAVVGQDIRDYLRLDDTLLEVDLTPNRADCLSVEGIAREVAVLNNIQLTPVQVKPVDVTHSAVQAVTVEAPNACPRYLGRLIKNVNSQAETPLWMQEKLRRSGLRSLGPLIDVTNFVLLELGQPLHAFDSDKLQGGIVVRKSRHNEKLKLLNDQIVQLDGEALVIADQKQALALAGIMGGSDTAVEAITQNIFLECAFFSPISIAGKARQFGLHTDSSHRFERGVDFTMQSRALERATQLIVEISGGDAGPVTEVSSVQHLPKRPAVKLRRDRIGKLLGMSIADDAIISMLSGLGMRIDATIDGWKITPPGHRFDINIEADLIEEIARLYGYNDLPSRSLLMRTELGKAPEEVLPLERAKDLLVDRGYQEVITYSFVDESFQQALLPDAQPIHLQNPISSEMSVMRTTLWCGLINSALYNTKRQQYRMRLFESGLRFFCENGEIRQQSMLAGLAIGNLFADQWGGGNRKIDFYDIKSDLEALFSLTGQAVDYRKVAHSAMHPGQSAQLFNNDGLAIGWLGMLHPTLEKRFGFESQVFLFELEIQKILEKKLPAFRALSRFPSVRRDIAVIVDEKIQASALIACIDSCQQDAIKSVRIFDIYQGQGVDAGFKSLALSMTLQDYSHTLTDSEIDAIVSKVLQKIAAELGARLRD